MSRNKSAYVCRQCGYDTVKWYGRCPGCGTWNSFDEEISEPQKKSQGLKGILHTLESQPLNEIGTKDMERFFLDNGELDGVLGGGIVPGSLVLVGGEPGIGKSTLLLQIIYTIGVKYGKTLYVSGEESAHQVRMRAERLGVVSSEVLLLTETNIKEIIKYAQEIKPVLMVVDSIQTTYLPEMSSVPGSISQIKQCTAELTSLAKNFNTAVFLVGHVTKEGTLAGPRVLEHMVDTVLYFEGERHHSFRLLRSIKNRFGSTNEIAVFEMQNKGLVPYNNPSQLFLEQRPIGVSGSTVVCTIQGTRPVLLEVQALVTSTMFGNPRRLTSGIDYNRILIILAVLEKIVGLNLSNQDVYVNIAGGFKIEDPAADLAVAAAIVSSFRNIEIDSNIVIIGEVGLGGETRAVTNLDRRLKEALKLGFTKAVVPKGNNIRISEDYHMMINQVTSVSETIEIIVGR
ncbi:MAG: DNA repair protein RadA [Bacillota bacterium]